MTKCTGFPKPAWTSRVAVVRRSAKTVKGGRRFSFGVLVVIGNGRGCIGLGWGKSGEVADAVWKAERAAAAERVQVALKDGRIAHEVTGDYCGEAYVAELHLGDALEARRQDVLR